MKSELEIRNKKNEIINEMKRKKTSLTDVIMYSKQIKLIEWILE